jgi:hypothetical protein
MAKKQSAGEAAAEAAKKRRPQPQKKTAAPKAGAKKPAAKPVKKARKREEPAQAELPIAPRADFDADIIEDADIIAESLAEPPIEDIAVGAARGMTAVVVDLADSSTVEVIDVDDQPPTLSAEEEELTALYGDDLEKPAVVHAEFSDRQTADEDRPMMPEINARDERKQQWQERRDRRRQRRDERDRQRHERREHQQQRAHEARQSQPGIQLPGRVSAGPPVPPPPPAAAAAVTNGHDREGLSRVGTPLGDAAATVFAQLRNGQPLPVRQLAAMMRKRSLVETDPEQLWPQLKAELLGDERSYRTLGLRPRIVYRGRDLFAPGPVAMSQTADAEANVAAALSRLAGATHRALAVRIAKASGAGFERLIHAYLVAAGYREIAWVKRVGGISYAQAFAPGIARTVLISARSGDQPIDRRGIGELRVGVEAKDLVAGILFSARELSEDAERELERAGRSIAVMCGDQLVAALIAAGVGVVSAAAPLHYVDDQLLDELLAG